MNRSINPLKRWLSSGAALLLALGLVGCGATNANSRTAANPPAVKAARPKPTTASAPVSCCGRSSTIATPAQAKKPVYAVTTLTGTHLMIPDGGPTVLYFMSAQCGSCIQGEQQLAQIQGQLPKSAQLISLDVTPQYDTPQMLASIAQSVGAHWPQAFVNPTLLQAYHVIALDQVTVIAASGHVVYNGALPSNGQLMNLIHEAAHA